MNGFSNSAAFDVQVLTCPLLNPRRGEGEIYALCGFTELWVEISPSWERETAASREFLKQLKCAGTFSKVMDLFKVAPGCYWGRFIAPHMVVSLSLGSTGNTP
jgi:hypothetical protein